MHVKTEPNFHAVTCPTWPKRPLTLISPGVIQMIQDWDEDVQDISTFQDVVQEFLYSIQNHKENTFDCSEQWKVVMDLNNMDGTVTLL